MDDEVNRRRWLLQLSATVTLSGLSGMDLGAEPESELPPGVYEPSLNHLAHVLKPEARNAQPYRLQFFQEAEFSTIRHLTGLMLGQSPDATPVPEIAEWIDRIVADSPIVQATARSLIPSNRAVASAYAGQDSVKELESADRQGLCRTGLAKLAQDGFSRLDQAQRLTRLTELEEASDPFIVWFKGRVIEGFYTSQIGLKELDYKGNSFYPVCPGCNHSVPAAN
jgi:Gluconate 2-dehydrogenase subunit 3